MERFLRFTWARETALGRVWMITSLTYAFALAALAVYFFACIAPWPVFVLVIAMLAFAGLSVATIIYLIERIDTYQEFQRIEQRREEQRAREIAEVNRRELERRTRGW
jgi:membrane protein implicated in regulation of membrane protease activity